MDDFNKPKILYPCIMSNSSRFIIDEIGEYFTIAPGNIITGKRKTLRYLIACLNSSIFYFALRKYYMGGGIEGELKTNRLLILPIPKFEDVDFNFTQKIEKLCKEISLSTNDTVNDYIKNIDSLLCDILKLTDDEFSYIKNFTF